MAFRPFPRYAGRSHFPSIIRLNNDISIMVVMLTGLFAFRAYAAEATGPLVVDPKHPQYFKDSSTGNCVFLTGVHTWNNLTDRGTDDRPTGGDGIPDWIYDKSGGVPGHFDFNGYLKYMNDNNQNFLRLWADDCYPRIYVHIGGKTDLTAFNEERFSRLRDRVRAASERGIYVGVMLWEGNNAGKGSRWNPANNVQGVDGDPDKDGYIHETVAEGGSQTVINYQKAYIAHVIDTVNSFDNVLYEIVNEDDPNSAKWQYEMINYIHQYEKQGGRKQHPVGMTIPVPASGPPLPSNQILYDSPADWISPNDDAKDGDGINPVTWDGRIRKVSIFDTDHNFGYHVVNLEVAWKYFLRGHNLIAMDRMTSDGNRPAGEMLYANCFRTFDTERYMSDVKKYADKMNLAAVKPHNSSASTGYCLANPGKEYLVFQPNSGSFTVDLSSYSGTTFEVEWFNPTTHTTSSGGTVSGGSSAQRFSPSFGPAVLYLRQGRAKPTTRAR